MTDAELREVLIETGHHHHQAYLESDGVDPEWALWYAAHLQTRLWDRLGRVLTRSEIVHLLIRGDDEVQAGSDPDSWPDVYARLLRERAAAA